MKKFNLDKFCKDLISLREKESQDVFAKRLNIKSSTLSLLENGKQVPNIDLLSKICSLAGTSADDYFIKPATDTLIYLTDNLEDSDILKINEMVERIRIKEKYEMLAKRNNYIVN